MTVVMWVLASLLCVVFLATGLSKIAQPKEKLASADMTRWAEDFSPPASRRWGRCRSPPPSGSSCRPL